MSMTEKQGGSDVRANTTIAKPMDALKTGPGHSYLLTSHKWFTSAPMSDGFLTLAKIKGTEGLSCFLVPRWLPDGTRNTGFRIMRLKDKLADKANASSEVEYERAWSMLLGEEGKGVKQIIEMVQSTRLDCILGSAGGIRRSLQHAVNHTSNRSAFGDLLINQPLMQNLLADLSVESEAHTMGVMSVAQMFDKASERKVELSNEEMAFLRVGIPCLKYFTTKRAPQFVYECMEVFGGNGFVEDFPMARLFRQSPLNSIWEGSGNVIALDIMRAIDHVPLFTQYLRHLCVSINDRALDRFIQSLESDVKWICDQSASTRQRHARNLTERLALATQGVAVAQFDGGSVAEAFIASRLRVSNELNYGAFIHKKEHIEDILQQNRIKFQ